MGIVSTATCCTTSTSILFPSASPSDQVRVRVRPCAATSHFSKDLAVRDAPVFFKSCSVSMFEMKGKIICKVSPPVYDAV